MIEIVGAALLIWAGAVALSWASRANPKAVATAVKRAAGVAALALALFVLVARGNLEIAVPLAGVGLWLMGWTAGLDLAPRWLRRHATREPPLQTYRSRMIELRIHAASGAMEGRVLEGRHAGRSLSLFDQAGCEELRAECASLDPGGAEILDFYIDRRFPGRRSAGQDDANARGNGGFRSGKMSDEDAYKILGLAQGASREDIARAHRALMKKVHPDHGGTASLAALLNEARDILTRRHR
jgi:hypothetical protein